MVRLFEQAAGAPFEVQHVPLEALIAQRAQAADSVQQSFSALAIDYATGGPIDMQRVARSFPLLMWTSMQDYALRVMAQPQQAE